MASSLPVTRTDSLGVDAAEIGRSIAYIAVPASLVPNGIALAIYALAAIGLLAVIRGATLAPRLKLVSGLLAAWLAVLVVIELWGGPRATGIPLTLFHLTILVAFPFFVVGLLEVRADAKTLAACVALTVVFAAVLSIVQFAVDPSARPGGLRLNPIHFGFVLSIWGMLSLCFALQGDKPQLPALLVALLALVPVFLSASRLIWFGTALGYAIISSWWLARRPLVLVTVAVVAIIAALGALQFGFARTRVLGLFGEVTDFVTLGSVAPGTFGFRFGAAITAWREFLEQPWLGHGLAFGDAGVLSELRAPGLPDFSTKVHLHNEYLTYLVAFGIPGLLFIATLIALFFLTLWWSGEPPLRLFAVAATVLICVFMLAEVVLRWPTIYGLLFFLMGVGFRAQANREPRSAQRR